MVAAAKGGGAGGGAFPDTAMMEEQRRKNKYRDHHHRRREGGREGGGRSRSSRKKAQYQLDIIDKLDVSSIYGTGMFHHDGPFDACNPSRNRKGLRSTPMEAFPEDSANNSLGGSGPVNPKMDLDLYHGYTVEAHNDFSASTTANGRPEQQKKNTSNNEWDAKQRGEVVHGAQTMGLGTSTHLDGTPASRAAIKESDAENNLNNQTSSGGGLQRKKSIAQRIRGISNRDSSINGGGLRGNRDSTINYSTAPTTPRGTSAEPSRKLSFQEEEEEEVGSVVENGGGGRISTNSLAPPRPGMIGRSRSVSTPKSEYNNNNGGRRSTNNNNHDHRSLTVGSEDKPSGGGLISRMKSLRKHKD